MFYGSVTEGFAKGILDYTEVERSVFGLMGVLIRASENMNISAVHFPATVRSLTLKTVI